MDELKTKEQIADWLNKVSIVNYTVEDDLTVNVIGDVNISNSLYTKTEDEWVYDLEKEKGIVLTYVDAREYSWVDQANRPYEYPSEELRMLKLPVNFGHVTGSFICSRNKLTTLLGAPASVGGSFLCAANNLSSLEGAPDRVGGDFLCGSNKLTTLEGSPDSVGGDFNCFNNNITTLNGSPKSVGGIFNCGNNELTTLEGSPKVVGGHFVCQDNQLTSLQGAPQYVHGDFVCHRNPLQQIGAIDTQIGIEQTFISAPLVEFSSTSNIDSDGDYRIEATVFNLKIAELKRIREERNLLELSIDKVSALTERDNTAMPNLTAVETIAAQRKAQGLPPVPAKAPSTTSQPATQPTLKRQFKI